MCTLFANPYVLLTCRGSPYGLHEVPIYILYLYDQMRLVGAELLFPASTEQLKP